MGSSGVDITSACRGCLQPPVGSQLLEAELFSRHVPKPQKTCFLLDPRSRTEGGVIPVSRQDPWFQALRRGRGPDLLPLDNQGHFACPTPPLLPGLPWDRLLWASPPFFMSAI